MKSVISTPLGPTLQAFGFPPQLGLRTFPFTMRELAREYLVSSSAVSLATVCTNPLDVLKVR
jgi:hypothetical protein